MNQAYLHSDNMESVRERLENTITQSSVETMYDGEDCFITVTQKNYETGNKSTWSFCVDFGTNKVQMLEPTEDEESFTSDNEVFRIIKNFLNGGMSREKRMNRPDYDSGEPIKIKGFGNKIGSSRKSIKSSKYIVEVGNDEIKFDNIEEANETFRQAVENNDINTSIKIYVDEGYSNKHLKLMRSERGRLTSSRKPIKSGINDRIIYKSDDDKYSIYLSDCKDANHGEDPHLEYGLAIDGRVQRYVRDDDSNYEDILEKWKDWYNLKPVQSSHKPIKSSWFKPEDVIGYLVGGDEDTITAGDEDEAAARDVYYYGYGIMDDGEKGHLFIGKYDDVKDLVENWLGLGFTDEFAYPYIINGVHITDSFQFLVDKPLPTEKDYQDFVNQLNKYVAENYETHGNYGPIYVFDMYKGEGTNTDGYGHEYPNYVIFDTEGNLDLFSGDEIVQYIDNLLAEKGWYHEAVSGSDNFTIAVNTN